MFRVETKIFQKHVFCNTEIRLSKEEYLSKNLIANKTTINPLNPNLNYQEIPKLNRSQTVNPGCHDHRYRVNHSIYLAITN